MKAQVTIEDLNNAIKAESTDICATCLISQTISRITGKKVRTAQAGHYTINFTFDGLYSENYIIKNETIRNLMDDFDTALHSHRNFDEIIAKLPFEFDLDIPEKEGE